MKNTLLCSLILVFVLFAPSLAGAQTFEFTYQGSLKSGGATANGNYDFEFALFDALTGGSQVFSTLTRSGVAVADGVFSVQLNFGNNFFAPNRFLEIRVRPAGGGAFTILTPRQPITSSPFSIVSVNAVNAVNATNATNAEQLGGIPANQFVLTGDARLSDARTPLPGSADYIQNRTTSQASSNFNISGTGSASVLNASTQYNLGGNRILTGSINNLFVGFRAGEANTGNSNSFFGAFAGFSNTNGLDNSFFGRSAGLNNTTGSNNSFFGRSTGQNNTTGSNNTLIGGGANVGSSDLSFATAIGADAVVFTNNTIVLGRENGSDKVRIFGFGAAGSTPLCRNSAFEISICSSSIRYKSNVAGFNSGLSLVKKLRPVAFDWKAGGMRDLGLVAEEVAEVEPLLVTKNERGETEGVKYDRVGVVLVNAVQEQQTQIEAQQKQINEQKELIRRQEEKLNRQQSELEALRRLVCSQNKDAEICRPGN